MKRAYLDRVQYDEIGILGWHAASHAQVTALGGAWEMIVPWRKEPDATRLARPGMHVVVLIDVPDHSALKDVQPLDVECATGSDLPAALQARPNVSPEITRTLGQAGLDTTKATLRETLAPLLEPHGDTER